MIPLATGVYSTEAVTAALHAERRVVDFRYELLDSSGNYLRTLTGVSSARVEYGSLREIKRTFRMTIVDDSTINFLSDLIRPVMRLKMPDGGWAEWPLGTFLITTPPRRAGNTNVVFRDVEGYDLGQVLVDDLVTDRYVIAAGTGYTAAVNTILAGAGLALVNIAPTALGLPVVRDWEPGTSKSRIVADLLEAVNFRPLYFDPYGVAIAVPYVSPAARGVEYSYVDDSKSVLTPGATHGLDLFKVPNKIVAVVSEADRPVLSSTYINASPLSLTSTARRGRTIVRFETGRDVADQATLDALVYRLVFEASQVYEQVSFTTALMPHHGDNDILQVGYSILGVSAKFVETGWSMDLVAGGKMQHTVRRVVTV